jgi:hypothetical protein
MFDEPAFAFKAAAVVHERAVCADEPVTGNHDGPGVLAHGGKEPEADQEVHGGRGRQPG